MSAQKPSDDAANELLPWQIRAWQMRRLTPEEIESLRQNGIRMHMLGQAELDRLHSEKLPAVAAGQEACAESPAGER